MTEIELAHANMVQSALMFTGVLVFMFTMAGVMLLPPSRPGTTKAEWPLFVGVLLAAGVLSVAIGAGIGSTQAMDVGESHSATIALRVGAEYLDRHHDASVEEIRAYICATLEGRCAYTLQLDREKFLRDETVTLIVGGSWTKVYLFKEPAAYTEEKRYSRLYASPTGALQPDAR